MNGHKRHDLLKLLKVIPEDATDEQKEFLKIRNECIHQMIEDGKVIDDLQKKIAEHEKILQNINSYAITLRWKIYKGI